MAVERNAEGCLYWIAVVAAEKLVVVDSASLLVAANLLDVAVVAEKATVVVAGFAYTNLKQLVAVELEL